MISFYKHSTVNLPLFPDFEKIVFFQKTLLFSKEPANIERIKLFIFQLHYKINLLYFGDKKIKFRIVQFSEIMQLASKRKKLPL